MVSVSVFGQQMVILNSAQTAIEMLDKKSLIYSDRPIIPMGGELVGWKKLLVLFLMASVSESIANFSITKSGPHLQYLISIQS